MADGEEAWGQYKAGPLFSPRGNKNHGATKRPFMAGYEAGVAAERERVEQAMLRVRPYTARVDGDSTPVYLTDEVDAVIRADREQEVWLVPQLAAELDIPANPADREPEPDGFGSTPEGDT